MNDLELAAIVIALVGVFRARRVPGADAFEPALDGNAVPLVAAALGGVLSLLDYPAPPWLALAHGACLGLVAVGAMTALKYVALPRSVCYRAGPVASPILLPAAACGASERGRGRWARQHDTSWFTPSARGTTPRRAQTSGASWTSSSL